MRLVRTVATAAALLISVASTEAQSPNDPKSAIDRKADIGNRLTVTTADGTEVMGRLLRLDGEDSAFELEAADHLAAQRPSGHLASRRFSAASTIVA
jgi:hypothetical protein